MAADHAGTVALSGNGRAETGSCTNCGTPLSGRFCSRCGQEDRPLDPGVGELVRELAQELSSLDSRVARSVRRLFFSPGFLTNEYWRGRRAAWVSPVRLYLIFSVAYFAIVSLTGQSPLSLNLRFTTSAGEDTSEAIQRLGFSSEEEMHHRVNQALESWIPRAMFVLVPLFAWMVSLVRRRSGRRYPQHLIFTLHLFAAFFGIQAVLAAARPITGESGIARVLGVTALVYVTGYAVLAMKAVYGGTIGRALAHTVVVGIFYWIATIVAAAAILVPLLWRS